MLRPEKVGVILHPYLPILNGHLSLCHSVPNVAAVKDDF